MKKSKALLLILFFSLSLPGCASPKNKEVPQVPAFISFSGQTENAKATVDGVEFVLDESFLRTNRYQLPAGKHSVTVRHGETVTVKRFFYLPGGVTKDIKIPTSKI
ncbi:MAG: hypothetical protein ACD_51C00352G0002 [uncultured bacterium]|nr:MAG: hypothetical protein ACD_51C00352G0002 [uncultured bacterium]HBG18043.1 hypothetical protein [Desulfobulbaceae bacterium]